MKLGRNAPCHCGSGLKYKHCCLNRDRERSGHPGLVWDFTSFRVDELATAKRTRFDREYQGPVNALRGGFVPQIGTGLIGQAAAELLEAYLAEVEATIAEVASRRSRHFWLHLSRRVPPKPLEGSTPWTTLLYRTVFSLALLKHGRPHNGIDDFEVHRDSGTLVPSQLEFEDLCDIYNLEYLAFEFNRAATAFRRVGKGAVLVPLPNSDFSAEAQPQLERLMQLVDRRVERYNSPFSHYGSSLDVWPRAIDGNDTRLYSLLPFAALNVEQKDFPSEAEDLFGFALTGTPNYVPAFLATKGIRDLLDLYQEQIVEVLGVPPGRLIAFLSSVGIRELGRMVHNHLVAGQFFQRAYLVTKNGEPLEATLNDLAKVYPLVLKEQTGEEIGQEEVDAEIRAILSALTYSEEELKTISLWDKVPYKLIVRHGEYLIWDYSNTLSFLLQLLSHVAFLSGKVGNVKSGNFENEVVHLIASTGGVGPWETNKELKASDGTKRQIDASFVRHDVLYVIECKAFAANVRASRGDWAALQDRWRMLLHYLTQAETLVEFLEANPEGSNYRIPKKVTRIEGCLCTPLAEYVPDTSPQYWLDDETPRICVPEEVLEFASGKKPRLLPS